MFSGPAIAPEISHLRLQARTTHFQDRLTTPTTMTQITIADLENAKPILEPLTLYSNSFKVEFLEPPSILKAT